MKSEGCSDLYIGTVSVLSGIRPAGRSIDKRTDGRKNHGLFFVREGEAHFWRQNNQKIVAKSGELLYIPKGCFYKMQYAAPSTTFVLANLELFDQNGNDVFLSKEPDVLKKQDDSLRVTQIMAELELCGTHQSLAIALRKKELLYRLLGEIFASDRLPSLSRNHDPRIFHGVRLLEQSYLENLPVSEFAKASNISISSFRSLFVKQFGISPVQYRNRLRLNRAAALLSEGSCTISEAAYASGFENLGYFCRCYKKILGETPAETKRRNN